MSNYSVFSCSLGGQAEDEDTGVYGEVSYSVPDESLFTINSDTGEIMTKKALDYEKQQVRDSRGH